jgi:Na+/H+ antiporter NhaD/arsenite permease-like protein
MSERRLKNAIGMALIAGHFGIIVVVVVLWTRGGYSFEEFTTCLALISPMFLAYTTAAIRYFIKNKDATSVREPRINASFAIVSILVPSAFVSAILAAVVLKAFNVGFDSFEQFKIGLAALQAAFGVYATQVLSSLYDLPKPAAPRKQAARSEARPRP